MRRNATGLLGLLAAVFLLSLGCCGGPVAGDEDATDYDDLHHDDLHSKSEHADAPQAMRARPVLLIPGFASSQLHAWKKVTCPHSIQKNLYRDVNIGDRIWIDVARILAQGDCWVRCMKLHMTNQSEIDCKLRAADGVATISELDPGLLTGPLSTIWGTLIRDLVEHFDLGPDQLVVAPYDWRLPPSKMQQRDKYFSSLRKKIEYTAGLHGDNGGMVVIAHSMGNGVFRYFLEWLKLELGRNHWQKWIDKHISTYFAIGSPLLGSSEALELLSSGITQGLPITQKEIRKLVVTFGSIISFLPIPSTLNSSHDTDTIFNVRLEATAGNPKREKNYTSTEVVSGQFFRDMAERDPIFGDLEKVRKRFYEDDDVLDHTVPWERPPIASVYSVYGVNLPTKHNYKYQDTDTEGHWYQLSLENEDSARHACGKTGDATVPYHSLSWAHTWLGGKDTLINVTQVPQSVYFSSDSVRTFQAKRSAESHHAQYKLHGREQPMCLSSDINSAAAAGLLEGFFKSSTLDQITFFEQRKVRANGAVQSTGVWEIDGAGHREILGNPAFLRELRAEMRNLFTGTTSSDKTSRPPVIDNDCYWNYRQAKCEFSEFCEYRYSFGDVTLDQSCRLRLRRNRPVAPRPPLVEKSKVNQTPSTEVAVAVTAVTAAPAVMSPFLDIARPYCSAPCQPLDRELATTRQPSSKKGDMVCTKA